MRSIRLLLVAVSVFGLAACGSGGSAEDSQAPQSNQKTMPNVTGKKLDVAETDIQKSGFDPDKIKFIGGGKFGPVIKSNWQVCAQNPAAGKPLPSTLQLTIERSCDSGSASASAAAPASTKPAQSSTASTVPTTLTIKNSKELAALLQGDDCSDSVATFAAKFAGRNIEFDGSVLAVGPAGDGTLDVGVAPGDKGSNSSKGPSFQFKGVDASDVADADLDDKIHVVATVGEFNAGQCLFFLTPVSVRLR